MIPASRPDFAALDLTNPVTSDPTPPAALELLAYVEWITRIACTAPYPQAALMFDGSTSGLAVRRVSAIVSPGTLRGRYYVTRYGYGTAAQAETRVSTDEGGLSVYSDAPSPVQGSPYYLPAEQQGGDVAVIISGNDTSTTSGAHSYVQLPETLAPSLVEIEVQQASGWSLHVPAEGQTHDLEGL